MRKRVGITIVAAMAMLSLGAAPAASAATEVGNNCTANAAVPNLTLLQLSRSGGSLPLTAPAAGVVTEWKVSVIPFGGSIPTRMRVFRSAGGSSFETVAESDIGNVTSGSNSFKTRIAVQAGDRFGGYGSSLGTLYCNTAVAADKMGIYAGDAGPGSTQAYEEAPENQVAMSVVIEPDADNDGYGDETQDLCPQSAAVQTACPIIALASYGIARRNAAVILATSSYPAAVGVSGIVNVPQRLLRSKQGKRSGKKGARASALIRIGGGVQTIVPGGLVLYTLKFPRSLRKALSKLPRKRALTLTATTSATDVAGRPSSSTVKVKVPGQKKNRPRGKAKGKRG